MRKLITIAAIAAAAIASPALAQDDEWTGAYAGVNVGYSGAKSDSTVVVGGTWAAESQALRDFVTANYGTQQDVNNISFGAQLGYNAQVGGSFVVGLEADVNVVSGEDITARGPMPFPVAPALTYTVTNTFDPKASYSIRAKAGVASGKTLFYATGGWGWTTADVGAEITSSGLYHKLAAVGHTFDGFEVGGGIEHKFGSNMSVRLEYIYADHGDFTYDTAYVAGSSVAPPAFNYTETFTQDLRKHQVRLGVNFHF